MSIIYDALKKSQQARAAKAPIAVARKKRINRKQAMISLLVLTTIFMIVTALTMTRGKSLSLPLLSRHEIKPTAIALNAAPRLMLDGVFLSDTEKMAMINRHSYHEGDSVNGMKVVSIAFDKVQLKNQTHSIILRNALTELN